MDGRKNNDIKPIVNYAVNNNIPVAAICGETFFMAENGYLNNRKHSSNTLQFLKLKAPHYKGDNNYIERQAVSDGDSITANGTATLEFAKEIMLYLNAKPEDKINEWYRFHKLGYYQS
ncbi:DJ-1/PfpI family protein [Clostridium cagae]|uniref:DJ-1/PfpI family protein n=1 Tax=Clostridium cagae TaxID=2080751 RepID=UPI003F76AAA6